MMSTLLPTCLPSLPTSSSGLDPSSTVPLRFTQSPLNPCSPRPPSGPPCCSSPFSSPSSLGPSSSSSLPRSSAPPPSLLSASGGSAPPPSSSVVSAGACPPRHHKNHSSTHENGHTSSSSVRYWCLHPPPSACLACLCAPAVLPPSPAAAAANPRAPASHLVRLLAPLLWRRLPCRLGPSSSLGPFGGGRGPLPLLQDPRLLGPQPPFLLRPTHIKDTRHTCSHSPLSFSNRSPPPMTTHPPAGPRLLGPSGPPLVVPLSSRHDPQHSMMMTPPAPSSPASPPPASSRAVARA